MATYVPGIQEYIPQVQPFKPDFNFFQSALEMKQAQYQAGYNKISSLYGQLLNSDLLRDPNKKRRDTFFTEIDSDIKRLSGVDLSLVENQKEAMGLFQPLIDNDFFRKDLAYTKEYQNQLRKADALRTNPNPKSDERYWQEGVTALNYQAEDFSKASDNESLYFRNPRYTPYINGYEKLFQFAKDNNINPEGISFENGFIVKYTNGVQAIPSLQNIFSSALLSDPRFKEMFNTQAYLDRKNYMKANADKFGGDEYAAETEYLTTKANEINEYYRKLSKQDNDTNTQIGNTKKVIEENIRTNGVDPDLDPGLVEMYRSLANDEAVQTKVVEKNKEVTSQFEEIDVNSLDRETLRNRIDGVYSYFLLDNLATKTAQSYAIGKAKYDIQVNPYQLESVKHRNRLIEKSVGYEYAKDLKMMDIASKFMENSGDGVAGASLNPYYNEGMYWTVPGPGNTTLGNIDIQERNATQVKAFDNSGIALTYQNAQDFLTYQNQILNDPKSTPEKIAKAEKEIQDVLGVYQVTEKAPEQKTTEFDWSEIALGAGELVGGAALAVVSGLGTLLSAGTATPLGAAGIGLGTTGVVSGASRLSGAWGGTETITPETVTQAKGLVRKVGNRYELVGQEQAVNLTDPNSSEYYFQINDRIKNFFGKNLTMDGQNQSLADMKLRIDGRSTTLDTKKQMIDGINTAMIRNNEIISGSLAREAGTDNQTAKLYFSPDFTRPRSLNEFTQAYVNANKDNVDRYPREQLGFQRAVRYVSDEERMEDMRDDAEDIFENLTDAYAELRKNPDGNLRITSFDTHLPGGLNRFYGRAATFGFDSALFGTNSFQYVADFFQKDFKPSAINPSVRAANGVKVVYGSGFNITADDYESEEFAHDPQAEAILNHYLSTSFMKGIHKSDKRPTGEVSYHAVAANDGNKVAVTFAPSPEYINGNAGNEKEKGITWELQQEMNKNEGIPPNITFFMDADKAQSAAFQAMQMSENEFLINLNGQLEVGAFNDTAGGLTITPNALGGYSYSGVMKAIDAAGKVIENPVFGNTDADLNSFVQKLNEMYSGISTQNMTTLQSLRMNSPNKVYDAEALLIDEDEE